MQSELSRQGCMDTALFITALTIDLGINTLRKHLAQLNCHNNVNSRLIKRFRLAVDRVFNLNGVGLVVTGTALAGCVNVGNTLWLTGSDCPVRVRGMHAQNQPTITAHAGQRIALNISGDYDKQQIKRGEWLLAQSPITAVERTLVEITPDGILQHWQPLHLHHATKHTTGRLSLLSGADNPMLAELILEKPLWLAENDRLILRDISAKKTLGVARVLHLSPPRRGKKHPAYLEWLTTLAQAKNDAHALSLHLSKGPLSLKKFAWARQLADIELLPLLSTFDLMIVADNLLIKEQAEAAEQKLLQALSEFHQKNEDQPGLAQAQLRRTALPTMDESLGLMLIANLLTKGKLRNTRGWLHLPEHSLAFTPQQHILWQKVGAYFSEDPWWVRDLATTLAIDENQIRALLRKAAQLSYVTAIVTDRYYLNQRIYQFANLIRILDTNQGSINAADFRNKAGVGRKLSIQILEFFNRCGFTRRKGNKHILRDRTLFNDYTEDQ